MRISASALLRACLLALLPMTAMAQAPVVVEAETGTLGSSLSIGTLGDVTYITGVNGHGTAVATALRSASPSYNVTFPAAGNYDLYVRIWAGPIGGNDDSFYISSVGFNNQNWGALYNTSIGWIHESRRARLRGRNARRGDTGRHVGVEMGSSN